MQEQQLEQDQIQIQNITQSQKERKTLEKEVTNEMLQKYRLKSGGWSKNTPIYVLKYIKDNNLDNEIGKQEKQQQPNTQEKYSMDISGLQHKIYQQDYSQQIQYINKKSKDQELYIKNLEEQLNNTKNCFIDEIKTLKQQKEEKRKLKEQMKEQEKQIQQLNNEKTKEQIEQGLIKKIEVKMDNKIEQSSQQIKNSLDKNQQILNAILQRKNAKLTQLKGVFGGLNHSFN